ncbi:tRNA lysidine(34) synthetase TilS [Neisseria sp. S1]|uniref:tRNA lysidine(34) synthetase TilS n=1 Tax=Neisseria sp. S1 TaxID=3318354 RepID=UPI003A88C90F
MSDSVMAPEWVGKFFSSLSDGGLRGQIVEVGLSGGLDSVVLLHMLRQLRERLGLTVTAVHVHHGLQEQADDWAVFCEELCQKWDIPLRIEYVTVETKGRGIEAAAREQRYQVFSRSKANRVALAHHRDDQVETFMLGVLRGGGLRSLSAMPELRLLDGKVCLWRPLLSFDRDELKAYARAYNLAFIEDPSNQDSSLLRNWLRHHGLPLWRERIPNIDKHIGSSVACLQDELAVLQEVVAEDADRMLHEGVLDLDLWRYLSPARRRQQLLYFAVKQGLGTPTAISVSAFEETLSRIGSGSAEWALPKGKAYAYRNRLFGMRNDWLSENALGLDNKICGRLNDILTNNGFTLQHNSFGLSEEMLRQVGMIRVVNTDDSLNLTVGRKSVWKILQECRVPPFLRPYWPIVTDSENRCIAIANIWVSVHDGVAGGSLPVFKKFNRFVLEPK